MESTGPMLRGRFFCLAHRRDVPMSQERERERGNNASESNRMETTSQSQNSSRKIYHQRTTTTQVVVDVGTQGAVVSKTTKGCIQKCSPWTAGWMDGFLARRYCSSIRDSIPHNPCIIYIWVSRYEWHWTYFWSSSSVVTCFEPSVWSSRHLRPLIHRSFHPPILNARNRLLVSKSTKCCFDTIPDTTTTTTMVVFCVNDFFCHRSTMTDTWWSGFLSISYI